MSSSGLLGVYNSVLVRAFADGARYLSSSFRINAPSANNEKCAMRGVLVFVLSFLSVPAGVLRATYRRLTWAHAC